MAEDSQTEEPDSESIAHFVADQSREVDALVSSYEPVSSLRSKFEALNLPTQTSFPIPKPKPQNLSSNKPLLPSPLLLPPRSSLDVAITSPRQANSPNDPSSADASVVRASSPGLRRRAPSPPKSRQNSTSTPTSRSISPHKPPPRVSISSPRSPAKIDLWRIPSPTKNGPQITAAKRLNLSPSHTNGHHRIPSRKASPSRGTEGAESQGAEAKRTASPNNTPQALNSVPPPVNRAAKPRMISENQTNVSEEPNPARPTVPSPRKVSPFNTPPHSDQSSPAVSPDASSPDLPPPRPILPRPFPVPGERRVIPNAGNLTSQSVYLPNTAQSQDEEGPALPPRKSSIQHQSGYLPTTSTSKPSALTMGFSSKSTSGPKQSHRPGSHQISESRHHHHHVLHRPHHDDLRMSVDGPARISVSVAKDISRAGSTSPNLTSVKVLTDVPDFPDSSHANRRPPYYPHTPRSISLGHDTRLLDTCRDLVCTTGLLTRVWSILTGKLVLSMPHEDMIRGTAICFKPTRKNDDDGMTLWVGTNAGGIMEVDIVSKRLVDLNSSAHAGREVLKLWSRGIDIWSLDDEGKLFVWPADGGNTPDLNIRIANGRVGRRPTASIVVANELWLAFGRDIRVVTPSATHEISTQQASPQRSLLQAGNDVTSAAFLHTNPGVVYFGQSDGKVSVFSRQDYTCIEVFGISTYKINTLVAVGPYLWSGQSTGRIMVYDTRTKPWTVRKDWIGHEHSILNLASDHNSVWKLDKLPVISLGTSSLHIWDGLLEEEWLVENMQKHIPEYANLSTLTSLVLTWNVGATKPTDLRYDAQDSNFFRELLRSHEPPDLLVIGLQELVDLEDKALTAKSFFKSRQKDTYGNEHLSSVYRVWRDYLSRSLEDAMPMDEPYALLHTASMIGLFTCVFIKAEHRRRLKDVNAAEIKTGMGGLHGNKGAIAVRLLLDDSSLCFINCHLAAGQTSTSSRNNDVASILDSYPLPTPYNAPPDDVFACGGDGSMIMDHEICILNGDLNYRIDTIPRDTIISAVRQNNFSKLLERDQLLLSKRKHPAFRLRQFQEGSINFAPTYKYDIGTDTYDSSEKRRSPAWCDRILYRGPMKQVEYRRHEVRVSDHRPVSSRFELRVKSVQQDKREACTKASRERFVAQKKQFSDLVKLKYLQEVFNLDAAEARKLIG